MSSLTYRITILGCRVNHAEAREMESVLRERGLIPASRAEAADLEVVHTCSVTNTAAAKSRQAIRRAGRRSEAAVLSASDAGGGHVGVDREILVTGCYAGTDPEEAGSVVGGDDRIITHASSDASTMIERFRARVDRWLEARDPIRATIRTGGPGSSEGGRTAREGVSSPRIRPLPVVEPGLLGRTGAGHIRAELKIQDGCDAHCTFCILPRIRPVLRSKRVADAVLEARRLVDAGHQEIVLSGIFIGAYGHETALRRRQERAWASPLADLIDEVAQVPGLQRLRLSSMEPGDASDALLDAMVANRPVVVPHLHLPLQSGSDAILRRMNRQYGVDDYLEMIDRVTARLTDEAGLPPAITTDVICGFPGETEADFERTVDVARRVGYLHMHVFPYSPKRGTAAARWVDREIPESVRKDRVRRLIAMEEEPEAGLSIEYRRRLLGREVRVILERASSEDAGVMTGRCDHYALVEVRTTRPRGSLVHVRIDSVSGSRTVGEVVPSGISLPMLSN